jgi:hypothetical protein
MLETRKGRSIIKKLNAFIWKIILWFRSIFHRNSSEFFGSFKIFRNPLDFFGNIKIFRNSSELRLRNIFHQVSSVAIWNFEFFIQWTKHSNETLENVIECISF